LPRTILYDCLTMTTGGTHPYREPAKRPKKKNPRKELVYTPESDERHIGPMRMFVRNVFIVSPLAGLIAYGGSPVLATILFVCAVVFSIWQARRPTDATPTILRVESKKLLLVSGRDQLVLATVPLEMLRNVELDTQEVERGQSVLNPDGVTSTHKGGMSVSTSRITFVRAEPKSPVLLEETYRAHVLCIEWLGKIRTFLRANGWVPEDERERSAPENSS